MTSDAHTDKQKRKKKKRDTLQPRIPEPIFGLLWVIMNVLVWGPLSYISFQGGQLLAPDGLLSIVIGLFLSLSFPVSWILGQGLLLKAQYGWSLRRWLIGIVGGLALAAPLLLILPPILTPVLHGLNLPGSVVSAVVGLLIIAPLLGGQMWALKRYVRQVWLWPVGTLTGLAVGFFIMMNVIMPLRGTNFSDEMNTFMAFTGNGAQGFGFGLVTGLVIIAMVRLTRNAQTSEQTTTQADMGTDTSASQIASRLSDTTTDENLFEQPQAASDDKQKGYSHG
jgi:hypothetical protein